MATVDIVLKPQKPIKSGNAGVYPPTTADQVILSNGNRLEQDGKISSDKLEGKTLSEIMLMFYPVGSIYMSANETSPAELFGGEWVRIENRFLLAAGDSYELGSEGGNSRVELTVDNLPEQSGMIILHDSNYGSVIHSANGVFSGSTITAEKYEIGTRMTGANSISNIVYNNGGKNTSFSVMPPYLSVYMWKRIA